MKVRILRCLRACVGNYVIGVVVVVVVVVFIPNCDGEVE